MLNRLFVRAFAVCLNLFHAGFVALIAYLIMNRDIFYRTASEYAWNQGILATGHQLAVWFWSFLAGLAVFYILMTGTIATLVSINRNLERR